MENLAHALKLKFGLEPQEPNTAQLTEIVREIRALGRPATDNEWRATVVRHCRTVGKYKYAGEDNSNLNALLAQMSTQAQTPRK